MNNNAAPLIVGPQARRTIMAEARRLDIDLAPCSPGGHLSWELLCEAIEAARAADTPKETR